MNMAAILLVAMGIEALVGWPDRVYRIAGHPVTWLGRLINFLDQALNRESASPTRLRVLGIFTTVLVVGLAAALAWAVARLLPAGPLGLLLGGILAWPMLATRSLFDHVQAVERTLERDDIAEARIAVAQIVGRDPAQLDSSDVTRAALESLAENTSDGIVAPIFWGVLLGLPGIAAYKAINTLDSMIGHRTPRHQLFGWSAARFDDVANLVPARLTGALFALVSGRLSDALSCMWRDASRHRSPNAGWPEAAMAGALGVRLSGPRSYGGGISDEPWLNAGASEVKVGDLKRGLGLYLRAMALLGAALALLAAV